MKEEAQQPQIEIVEFGTVGRNRDRDRERDRECDGCNKRADDSLNTTVEEFNL